jgi:hypothetical protein
MRFHPTTPLLTSTIAITLCAVSARAEHSSARFPDESVPNTAAAKPRPFAPSQLQPPPNRSATQERAPAALPNARALQNLDEDERAAERRRKAWMLSLEGVTHAPIDVGAQLGLETPQGLRLFGGYGWVPGGYMNLLTGIAASASSNGYAEALLNDAQYSGHTWRIQAGFRPFRAIGLYGDVGYARLTANGELDLSSSSIPQLAMFGGGYTATTRLDLWLIELGYEGEIADRIMLGLALGMMKTFKSKTTIAAVDGAPTNNEILDTAAKQTDTALEKYGVAPTLTLRLGFDLI